MHNGPCTIHAVKGIQWTEDDDEEDYLEEVIGIEDDIEEDKSKEVKETKEVKKEEEWFCSIQ